MPKIERNDGARHLTSVSVQSLYGQVHPGLTRIYLLASELPLSAELGLVGLPSHAATVRPVGVRRAHREADGRCTERPATAATAAEVTGDLLLMCVLISVSP